MVSVPVRVIDVPATPSAIGILGVIAAVCFVFPWLLWIVVPLFVFAGVGYVLERRKHRGVHRKVRSRRHR